MYKRKLLCLMISGFINFNPVQAMDSSGSNWSVSNTISFLRNLTGNLLKKSCGVNTAPDYFSELPDEVISDYILPSAITAFDLSCYHGVKGALAWMVKLRMVNKKMKAILSDDAIARIIRESKSNINGEKVYDTPFEELPFLQKWAKIVETYPAVNHQVIEYLSNNSSHSSQKGTLPRPTLIRWAAKKGQVQLVFILLKAAAKAPKTLLPRLEKLGIDIDVIPEKQLTD